MRVNLLGGPGCGKSTTAAWLFSELKVRQVSVELVTEYVKVWACQKRKIETFDQVYLLGKQMQYEHRFLTAGVEHVITDSPVILSGIYAEHYDLDGTLGIARPLLSLAEAYEKKYPSVNIILDRKNKPYITQGRYQTHEQAREIDQLITRYYLTNKDRLELNVAYFDYRNREGILTYVLTVLEASRK